MNRIYHPYWMWEDFKAGFYDNISGEQKKEMINKVVELFSDNEITRKYMIRVIDEWVFSCQHNLSNESLNRIAYLGQGACCLFAGVPSTITMEAWSLVSKENQDKADGIAKDVLNIWINRNKKIELCLSLD